MAVNAHYPPPFLYWQKKLFYTPHNVQGTIEGLRDPWVGAVWDHCMSCGAKSNGHCVTIVTIVQLVIPEWLGRVQKQSKINHLSLINLAGVFSEFINHCSLYLLCVL